MSQQDNIAAQQHLAENLNAGNIETAVESFAVDAVDHDPAPRSGRRPGGLQGVLHRAHLSLPRRAHRAGAHGRRRRERRDCLHADRHPPG